MLEEIAELLRRPDGLKTIRLTFSRGDEESQIVVHVSMDAAEKGARKSFAPFTAISTLSELQRELPQVLRTQGTSTLTLAELAQKQAAADKAAAEATAAASKAAKASTKAGTPARGVLPTSTKAKPLFGAKAAEAASDDGDGADDESADGSEGQDDGSQPAASATKPTPTAPSAVESLFGSAPTATPAPAQATTPASKPAPAAAPSTTPARAAPAAAPAPAADTFSFNFD